MSGRIQRVSSLSTILALGSVGASDAANVASSHEKRIASHVNGNVCDGWQYTPDVEGEEEFDVVGYEDEMVGLQRGYGRSPQGGGRGGRGGGGARGGMHPGSRGPQRGGFQGHMAPGMHPGMGGMNLPPGVPHPNWFAQANPFGIQAPMEGLIQLPLAPVDNVGIITATTTAIKFLGRVQKPFRGERVLATVKRQGASTANIEVDAEQGIVVGTIPQQAQIGAVSIDEWAGNNFGVRMAMNVATPGMDIVCNVLALTAPTAPDQIVVRLTIYGRFVGV